MSIEQPHVALPKLYGGPAYARPPMPVTPTAKPFDPDAMPIEAEMDQDERSFASSLPSQAYATGGAMLTDPAAHGAESTSADVSTRTFSLRAIAARLRGDD